MSNATKSRQTADRSSPSTGEDYLDLIRRFPLRRINTAAENGQAVALVKDLMLRDQDLLTEGQSQYLGALSVLIEEFESKAYPPAADSRKPHERLQWLVRESGISQRELAKTLGVKQPAASLILCGKRGLTTDHVRRLANRFKVRAEYFL